MVAKKRKKPKYGVIVHEPDPPPVEKKPRQVMTAAERRNWFRVKAGWPELRTKSADE